MTGWSLYSLERFEHFHALATLLFASFLTVYMIYMSSSIRRETTAQATDALALADLKLILSPWASSSGAVKLVVLAS